LHFFTAFFTRAFEMINSAGFAARRDAFFFLLAAICSPFASLLSGPLTLHGTRGREVPAPPNVHQAR